MATTWYLERVGASATRVALLPDGGTGIGVELPLPGGVFDAVGPAAGETRAARTVWTSPAQKPKITIPPLVFTSLAAARRLEALCASGFPMTLSTDYGETYTVRAVTSVKRTILDTPDRLTAPQIRVTVQLVAV